jgi:hypothetical protein
VADIAASSSTIAALKGAAGFGMSPWAIGAALFFSVVGAVYVKMGRSESRVTMLVCGVALLGYGLFVQDTLYVVLIGLALSAAPFLTGD